VEFEALHAVLFDQAAHLARTKLAFVRVHAAEGDHDVAVGAGSIRYLFVRNAASAQLRFGIHREVDEADLFFAVVRHRLVHRRAFAGAEELVGGAVVLLAVVVEGVAAGHLQVGVHVDGDQVVGVHGVAVL
jgi:hypothetical protein